MLYHKHINDGKAEPYFKTRISFENTSDSIPCLIVKRQAHGNSYTQAVKNAQKTIYRHQWNNDTLHLDTYFQLDTALWRGNQIQVQIEAQIKAKVKTRARTIHNTQTHKPQKKVKLYV